MKQISFIILLVALAGFTGCPFFNPASNSTGSPQGVIQKEKDVSGKMAVALGGTATEDDEIILNETIQLLELSNEAPELFTLKIRDGFDSFTSGQGARIVPQKTGIGYVTPTVNGKPRSAIQVTVPPQKLIQILMGEARGELAREATTASLSVKTSSVSNTGDAIAAVIRNRINLINEMNKPGLFKANVSAYQKDIPLSYYEAVIEANDGVTYQFSPVNPTDPSYLVYTASAKRTGVGKSLLTAYDQALLTAADIFNGDTKDPTKGAFGFFSPTESQYLVLKDALDKGAQQLPPEGGISDARFPELAPLQVLMIKEIASSSSLSSVPSFVFVRSRDSVLDPAVTDTP